MAFESCCVDVSCAKLLTTSWTVNAAQKAHFSQLASGWKFKCHCQTNFWQYSLAVLCFSNYPNLDKNGNFT